MKSTAKRTEGIALVTALIFMAMLLTVLTAYLTMSTTEARTSRASSNSVEGFYAAEGGLNLRAELVRTRFKGYRRPEGVSPSSSGGAVPCTPGNMGSGDMACLEYTIGGRKVMTYTQVLNGGVPSIGVVEPGDTYTGMNYQQYEYAVQSVATNASGERETTLEMKFQSRLVPLFQFAAFYNKDLEIHPGPAMTLGGRVHTNANLYLNANATLDIAGKTTAVGDIYRSGKDGRGCSGAVRFSTVTMPCYAGGGTGIKLPPGELTRFGGNVLSGQNLLTVPPMSSLAPDPTGANESELWLQADVRVVAKKLSAGGFEFNVVNADNSLNGSATAALNNCTPGNPPVSLSTDFWDAREAKFLTLIEVDQTSLMKCIQNKGLFTNTDGNVLRADDTSGGGMAWHFSFDDGNPNTNALIASAATITNYGVKIRNAARLGPTSAAVDLTGLTITTNQQLYVQGDYNTDNKKPAALIADAINVLSNNVTTNIPEDAPASLKDDERTAWIRSGPRASETTVNAAFLSGIDETTAPTLSEYNGGLQNYPRFHENWNNIFMRYRGSFVSLGNSIHVKGKQRETRYSAPQRDWNFDTDFNDANKLPPLTPRFVYLRQLLFARTW
ncbi:pilus assembly PilX N-terminal domain-containing protein [Deinococcus frigens]|uniref:pilus assembly PilX N-terminal domain-containing protein n=1 Tax=Deinococcus frigens TaxID=249403 RepID=UPI000497A796|nr:pilus assembly PilX N-terminal domain-containing protein [Deinococcus frigens]